MEAVTDWYVKLAGVHFDKVGSLYLDRCGDFIVGPECTPQPQGDRTESRFLGPFHNAKQRYLALIDDMLDTIRAGRYHGNPTTMLHTYLAYLAVRKLVDQCDEMEQGPWYPVAGEAKADQWIFRDDWTLSGVVDWEWWALDPSV